MPLLAPLHVLSYGTLLGTELYQTFVMTKICFQALPMAQFTTLQKRVFPIYFRMQSALLLATILTYPPSSLAALRQNPLDLYAFSVAFLTSVLNLLVYGRRTQKIMVERIHQETRDGRKYNEKENMSEEMRKINRRFSKAHAMSIHLNLLSVIATVAYGFTLGGRIKIPE